MKAYINEQDLLYDVKLSVEQERVEVTPMQRTEPDWKWAHVDQAGHFHAFSTDKEDHLPTLIRELVEVDHREEEDYGDSWLEEHTSTEVVYKCRMCGTVVSPQWVTRPSTYREYAPGRLSWRVELRAVGSNCDKLQALNGWKVSVRIEVEGETYFGTGLLQTLGMAQEDNNGIRWFGAVHGSGRLGQRKAGA